MSQLKVIKGDLHVEFQLNRPDKKNALNASLIQNLRSAFEQYSAEPSCRVIVLSGAGDVFSSGADLDALRQMQKNSYVENLDDSMQLAALFRTMYLCDKPILGKINGHAIAGGCGLLTLCDLSVSLPTSKFGYTETRIGFVPAMVARFLVAKIGDTKARKLLLSGIIIDAFEAEKIGLVSEVTDNLNDRISFWVEHFSKKVSPESVKTTKQVMRGAMSLNWDDALNHAAKINATSRQSQDCIKGVNAFLNKENMDW